MRWVPLEANPEIFQQVSKPQDEVTFQHADKGRFLRFLFSGRLPWDLIATVESSVTSMVSTQNYCKSAGRIQNAQCAALT